MKDVIVTGKATRFTLRCLHWAFWNFKARAARLMPATCLVVACVALLLEFAPYLAQDPHVTLITNRLTSMRFMKLSLCVSLACCGGCTFFSYRISLTGTKTLLGALKLCIAHLSGCRRVVKKIVAYSPCWTKRVTRKIQASLQLWLWSLPVYACPASYASGTLKTE